MNVRFVATVAALALGASAFAQPPQIARETASATVGGKKVSIEYGRPPLKGRSFDELIKQLPADRMWRAGANQVTTLTTEGPIMIGGKTVAAGKYSLYVHAPESGPYSLAINSDLGVPLGKIWGQAPEAMKNEPWPHLQDYDKNAGGKEVARASMAQSKPASPVDLFTIKLTPAGDGATMNMSWGDRSWAVEIKGAK